MLRLLLIVFVAGAGWVGFAHLHTRRAAAADGPVMQARGPNVVGGAQISLDGYAPGRPLVVNIWASWCAACIAEANDIRSFAATHPGALLSINTEDAADDGAAAAARWHWPQPSISDPSGAIAWPFHSTPPGLPTTVFLNANHRVVGRVTGEIFSAQLESGWQKAGGG
ncbi:MAG TPA: TlpA family protein disulfide reductase [Gaiellaceae bacterium]|nr:TlpA family protein disulfide reductase [Gaiellaceae bacterium]